MNQSVLIVDDSPEIHQLVELRLQAEAVTFLHAFDAESGLAMARTQHPDLILLDLDLNGTSGIEVCRQLKSSAETQGLAIVILSATSDVHIKVEAFEIGAVDYVTKPFDPVELRARVRASLRAKRYQDLLTTRAQVDGLTGLWNRAYFDGRLQAELSGALRHERPIGLAILDIDHFKKINDEYGHPFGDTVLQRVGDCIAATVRVSDVACRYGGEEFVVILRETDPAQAAEAGERLRKAIEGIQFRHGRKSVVVTASVGVAGLGIFERPREVTPETLLAAADRALYEAKHAGRNRVVQARRS